MYAVFPRRAAPRPVHRPPQPARTSPWLRHARYVGAHQRVSGGKEIGVLGRDCRRGFIGRDANSYQAYRGFGTEDLLIYPFQPEIEERRIQKTRLGWMLRCSGTQVPPDPCADSEGEPSSLGACARGGVIATRQKGRIIHTRPAHVWVHRMRPHRLAGGRALADWVAGSGPAFDPRAVPRAVSCQLFFAKEIQRI